MADIYEDLGVAAFSTGKCTLLLAAGALLNQAVVCLTMVHAILEKLGDAIGSTPEMGSLAKDWKSWQNHIKGVQ